MLEKKERRVETGKLETGLCPVAGCSAYLPCRYKPCYRGSYFSRAQRNLDLIRNITDFKYSQLIKMFKNILSKQNKCVN